MGDILELIQSRRTVKSFEPKFVSWELISKVLDAGRHAPSCGNIQNWKFIVILSPDIKQQIADAAYDQYEIAMAGALIVVVAELDKGERYYGVRGERLYSIQNCAAAAQNMLLEAHSLGLGSCWIGAFDEDKLSSIIAIPENVRPQMIIAIGYAKEVPEKPPKYPLETVVYFHRWRSKFRDVSKYCNDYAVLIARKTGAVKGAVQKAGQFVVDKTQEVGEVVKQKINEKKWFFCEKKVFFLMF